MAANFPTSAPNLTETFDSSNEIRYTHVNRLAEEINAIGKALLGTIALTAVFTKIGIGVTPTVPLDIVADSGASGITQRGRAADGIGTFRLTSNDAATVYGYLQGRSTDFRINVPTALPMIFYTNDTEVMRLGSAGAVFINDTANANMTIGLTINQGTATNEIMNFKQNNVAHGVTTVLETDSFGAIYQVSGGEGGLAFYGISETTTGMQLYSVHTTDNTTKTTAGDGTIRLQALLKSGTGTADCGAGANLFVIMNRVTTNFIVGSDALHSNFALTEYDEYDDLSLIRA